MKTTRNTALYVKIGIFVTFFLLIFLSVLLLMMLLIPSKDITDLPITNSFTGQDTVSTSPSQPAANKTEYHYTFKSDLSAYEQYMNPEGDEYLFLVNTSHRLDADYVPDDMIPVVNTRNDRAKVQMREYAAKALEAFFIEAETEGMTYLNERTGKVLSVMSAYRSYSYQQQLFDNQKALYASYGERAEEMAAKEVQYPGCSEHQSGLCCDMHNIASADISFESEAAATWLKENCYKFGFILRYPKDKTEITGISFEPWHFRYVGRYHASRMHELGMCLEEYMEYLDK